MERAKERRLLRHMTVITQDGQCMWEGLCGLYLQAGAIDHGNDSRNRNDILANALESEDLGSRTGNRVRGISSCTT